MYTRDDLPNYLSRHVYDTLAPIFAVKDNRMRHYLGVPLREEEDMPKLGERALRRALRGTREPACLWANYSPNMLSRLYQDMPRDVKNALKVVCGHHYTAAEYLRSLRSMGATVRSAGRTARLVRSHAQRGRRLALAAVRHEYRYARAHLRRDDGDLSPFNPYKMSHVKRKSK